MALTFTQVPVTLRVNNTSLAGVVEALDMINANNPNNIYTIETSFHVSSMEDANTVETALNILKDLGSINTCQWDNIINQINGFRRNYLK